MASSIISSTTPSPSISDRSTRKGAFAVMTSLFFMWGFMTVFNDILIPRFRDAFTLSYFEAMLVQFAFFGAYFVGALLYFIISAVAGDPIAKVGYKNGVVIGLLIAAGGSALFLPAASLPSYQMFLVALFIMGLGFAMLQIAANPYVTILGPERTASSRLNLAQGFNSFGTTIGPLIGGWLIFRYFDKTGSHGADSVKLPYLAFSIVFAVLALVFFFIHLPHIGDGKAAHGVGALKYPHVVLGIIAIFMYVGGEVSVGSTIINFLGQKNVAGLSPVEASKYVSLFWGGMLVGRFMGAVQLGELNPKSRRLLLVCIPVAAIAILGSLHGWVFALNYLPFIVLCWLLFQFGNGNPARTLMIFSMTVMGLLLTAIAASGLVAISCVVAIGLFSSIGWSNTFSLALEGTGSLKSQVSSLLVMGILGGAILPPIQGLIADATKNLQFSFIVPLVAYAYVAFYGGKGHKIHNKSFQ